MPDPTTRERLADHPRMPRVGAKVANRYEIINIIGEGGFAVVYRARDTQLGGLVALKVLEPAKSMDQGFTKRFVQEINLVRELRHHNTIKIWDAGKTDWDCLYYAMELIEGEELGDLINRSGGLPLDRVVRIISQALRSLGEAHKAGIIHRDLKPGNIMVCQLDDEPDYVKVYDFGIAKAQSAELTRVKTQTGMVMCTPNYASPEMLRNQEVTPASDLYAMGLIMAEMVTGRKVVQADSLVDIITIQASPAPLTFDPQLRKLPIGSVIAKATAKAVAERYQSASEMLAALRELGNQPPAPIPAPPTPGIGVPDSIALMKTTRVATDPGIRASEGKSRASRAIAILLGVVFLLAVAVFAVMKLVPGEVVEEVATERMASGDGPAKAEQPVAEQPVDDPVVPVPDQEALQADNRDDESAIADSEGPEIVATPDELGELHATPDNEEPPQTAPPASNELRLTLTSHPSRVRVYVDGQSVGRTPLDELVQVGGQTVEVTLRKTDYRTARFEIPVSDGLFERDVRMRREASEPETVGPEPTEPGAAPTFDEIPLDFGN